MILHVGINDLLSSRDNITTEEEVATENNENWNYINNDKIKWK